MALKFKLGKDVSIKSLDGTSVPLEDAGGKYAIVELRMYANAAKIKGVNAGAFIGCSIVGATELAETETSAIDLPQFDGIDAGEVRMTVPAAGSGAARSPDEDAALVRARSPAGDAATASTVAAKAPRTKRSK